MFRIILFGLAVVVAMDPVSPECAAKFRKIPNHSACLVKDSRVTKSGVSDSDKKLIVDLHNDFRGKVSPPAADMLQLSWDDEVAMIAQKWADSCANYHETPNIRRSIPGRFALGQNLAYGYRNWQQAITAWYNEYKLFTYGNTPQDKFGDVGHYTQMVWAKSRVIGCGFAVCPHTQYGNHLFCNYGEGGNSGDWSKPYKMGSPAADCRGHKKGNLCACSPVCENQSKYNLGTCTCECQQKFHVGPNCKMDCEKAKVDLPYTCTKVKEELSYCTRFSNIPPLCPYICNVCPLEDSTSGGGSGGGPSGDGITTPASIPLRIGGGVANLSPRFVNILISTILMMLIVKNL